jgi:hypothetical protein
MYRSHNIDEETCEPRKLRNSRLQLVWLIQSSDIFFEGGEETYGKSEGIGMVC